MKSIRYAMCAVICRGLATDEIESKGGGAMLSVSLSPSAAADIEKEEKEGGEKKRNPRLPTLIRSALELHTPRRISSSSSVSLSSSSSVNVACLNSPRHFVLSGPVDEITTIEAYLYSSSATRLARLHVTSAFHSSMMEKPSQVLSSFFVELHRKEQREAEEKAVKEQERRRKEVGENGWSDQDGEAEEEEDTERRLPLFASNVLGSLLRPRDMFAEKTEMMHQEINENEKEKKPPSVTLDHAYWAKHMRSSVRFHQCMRTMLQHFPRAIFVEVTRMFCLFSPSFLVVVVRRGGVAGVAWRGVAWRGVAWRGVAWRRGGRCCGAARSSGSPI